MPIGRTLLRMADGTDQAPQFAQPAPATSSAASLFRRRSKVAFVWISANFDRDRTIFGAVKINARIERRDMTRRPASLWSEVVPPPPTSTIRVSRGRAMAQRKFRTNVLIRFEPDEAGWVRATVAGMPSVVAAGTSRDDALEMAIHALMQTLAVTRIGHLAFHLAALVAERRFDGTLGAMARAEFPGLALCGAEQPALPSLFLAATAGSGRTGSKRTRARLRRRAG
jgi:hypothetical protein